MRKPALTQVAVLAAGISGCFGAEIAGVRVHLNPDTGDVAVGAQFTVGVFVDQTDCFQPTSNGGFDVDCVSDPVGAHVIDTTLQSDGSFALVTADPLVLHATSAGTATVTVTGANSAHQGSDSATFTAWDVDDVTLTPQCDEGGDPTLFHVGARVPIEVVLRHGTRELIRGDYLPFDTGGAATFETPALHLLLSSTAQTMTITSPDVSTFSQVHDIVDGSGFDAVDMTITTPDCNAARILTTPRRGSATLCTDNLARTYTIETPGVCTFDAAGTLTDTVTWSGGDVPIYSQTAGLCLVRVELAGGPSAVASVDFNGCQGWEELAPGGTYDYPGVRSVWPMGPAQAWFAVGEPDLIYYDGASLSTVSTGSTEQLHAVWAMGTQVFAAGRNGTVVRYDGNAWEALTSPLAETLSTAWGSDVEDVYIGGALGKLLHWNGSDLSEVATGATAQIERVWGTSASDVYIQTRAEIMHFDGASWTMLPRPTQQPTGPFLDLHGLDASTVFVAVGESFGTLGPGVYEWNNTGWTERATFVPGTTLSGLWAAGVDEIYVGTFANLYQVDAVGATFVESPTVGNVTAVAGSGSTLFFVGTGIAVRR